MKGTMENNKFIMFFTCTVLVIAMHMVFANIESIQVKEILRARRAAAPRSYMHAEDCKGVNRTFALMDDYPFCQTFVVCDPAGHKYVYDCPSGLWFNETTQECDYPENLEKDFREECGNLISAFEADFFKRMADNRKKSASPNSQAGPRKQKQKILSDSQTSTQVPEQYVDESQPAVTPRRRTKPQQAVVTQSSENMAYEYYETPEEPIRTLPGQMTSVPVIPNRDFEISQRPLRNSRPIQISTQSPLQGNYDYYDDSIPQIQGTELPPQQPIIPQERPQLPSQQISTLHQQQSFGNFPQQTFQQRPQQTSQFPSQQVSQFYQQQGSQQRPQQTSQFPSQQVSKFRQQQGSQQLSPLQQQQAFGDLRAQPKNDIEYDV